MTTLGDRVRRDVHAVQESVRLLAGTFTINGTSNPTLSKNTGDLVGVQVTRAAAGRFTFTLPNLPYAVLYSACGVSKFTGNTEDVYGQCDASAGASTGVVTVHTKTGSSDTDPADTEVVQVLLICTTTDRTEVR